MSKQNNKHPYGKVLWLHFNLLLNVMDKTGNVVTTIREISDRSNIPKKSIKSILDKLIRYRLIKLKQLNTQYFLVTLNYLEE